MTPRLLFHWFWGEKTNITYLAPIYLLHFQIPKYWFRLLNPSLLCALPFLNTYQLPIWQEWLLWMARTFAIYHFCGDSFNPRKRYMYIVPKSLFIWKAKCSIYNIFSEITSSRWLTRFCLLFSKQLILDWF